jgi:hypothetical protein
MRGDHATYIEGWMAKAGATNLPPTALVALCDRALGAIWQRTRLPLGEITLDAIADRVLQIAQEKYAFLAGSRRDSTGISLKELGTQNNPPVQTAELREGLCFLLIEFLNVIGTVTGEILTPGLRAEISKLIAESTREARRDPNRRAGGLPRREHRMDA